MFGIPGAKADYSVSELFQSNYSRFDLGKHCRLEGRCGKWHGSLNDLGCSAHASHPFSPGCAFFTFKMRVWQSLLELTTDPHASLHFPAPCVGRAV